MRTLMTKAGLVAAAVVLLTATAGTAAQAAEDTELSMELKGSPVLATGEQDTVSGVFTLTPPPELTRLSDLAVVLDVTELAGVAKVVSNSWGEPCRQEGQTVTCWGEGEDFDVHGGSLDIELFRLEGVDGAEPGTTVELPVSFTTSNFPAVSGTVSVTKAEVVDLAIGDEAQRERNVELGGSGSVDVSVANVGDNAAAGTALSVAIGHDLRFENTFSNCTFDESNVVCRFERELLPGERYALSEEIAFTARTTAEAPGRANLSYSWSTLDTFDSDIAPGLPADMRPGTLPAVTLDEVSALKSVPEHDPNWQNDSGNVDVFIEGENPVDFAAVGATVRGDAGTVGDLTVGARNDSGVEVPGAVEEPSVVVTVTLPAELSFVEAPGDCVSTGDQSYECGIETVSEPGQSHEWTFKVRIEAATAAEGSVVIRDSFADDRDASNDEAVIKVNTTEAPAPEPTGGAGGAGAAIGGDLALTGTGLRLILGGGVLALVAGASLFVLTRRRKALVTGDGTEMAS
ncbi:hypothetical protein [Phytomonospora endophytica]|uniref:DUF11 domain-containing protein n=1 Tax=Phytomonospora endophytica TaxID=714109 RepID=A0A841FZU6_9ACTN|nr:hypothetical protein [Phytomonospora endophytica]MBB6037450.1 hypothetical protein [Phytomonospora endophytica]GIG70700.1 hypothetical protein Pen01_69950 [Phytomonospora endophytica]